MGDRLKNRFGGASTSTIEDDLKGINQIIQATREQNFVSPYIHDPEVTQRKREADPVFF